MRAIWRTARVITCLPRHDRPETVITTMIMLGFFVIIIEVTIPSKLVMDYFQIIIGIADLLDCFGRLVKNVILIERWRECATWKPMSAMVSIENPSAM